VNPAGTSQHCSGCGVVVPKSLRQRVHRCGCGLTLDRDVNAARNILQRAGAPPSASGRGRQLPAMTRESSQVMSATARCSAIEACTPDQAWAHHNGFRGV
jgi:transposase